MKIVFSPTKTQKRVLESPYHAELSDQTKQLKKAMEEMTVSKIQQVMKISDALANEVYGVYHTDYAPLPAYMLYEGPSFKAINASLIKTSKANDVYVLSAYHGIVPFTKPITPYRLDMGMPILEQSLYAFWAESMGTFFEEGEKVLSLASKEFEKLVPKHCDLIEVKFYRREGETLKAPSYDSKVARGLFLEHILEQDTDEVLCLQKFSKQGYVFNAEMSDEKVWVFIR